MSVCRIWNYTVKNFNIKNFDDEQKKFLFFQEYSSKLSETALMKKVKKSNLFTQSTEEFEAVDVCEKENKRHFLYNGGVYLVYYIIQIYSEGFSLVL